MSARQKAPPPAPQPNDTCGAARHQYLRGAPESQAVAVSFSQPVRIAGPGGNVTLDYLPERLNFTLGAGGTVIGISRG